MRRVLVSSRAEAGEKVNAANTPARSIPNKRAGFMTVGIKNKADFPGRADPSLPLLAGFNQRYLKILKKPLFCSGFLGIII